MIIIIIIVLLLLISGLKNSEKTPSVSRLYSWHQSWIVWTLSSTMLIRLMAVRVFFYLWIVNSAEAGLKCMPDICVRTTSGHENYLPACKWARVYKYDKRVLLAKSDSIYLKHNGARCLVVARQRLQSVSVCACACLRPQSLFLKWMFHSPFHRLREYGLFLLYYCQYNQTDIFNCGQWSRRSIVFHLLCPGTLFFDVRQNPQAHPLLLPGLDTLLPTLIIRLSWKIGLLFSRTTIYFPDDLTYNLYFPLL